MKAITYIILFSLSFRICRGRVFNTTSCSRVCARRERVIFVPQNIAQTIERVLRRARIGKPEGNNVIFVLLTLFEIIHIIVEPEAWTDFQFPRTCPILENFVIRLWPHQLAKALGHVIVVKTETISLHFGRYIAISPQENYAMFTFCPCNMSLQRHVE